MSQGTMIDAQSPGKAGLIVGLSEEMGLVELFNEKLSSNRGRPEDIPNGVMAQMMAHPLFNNVKTVLEHLGIPEKKLK